jgi:LacI family transcriptional regulator
MATIRDVAEHANVSVATVSRVLNDKGYVKSSTREKIEKSIQRLNYTPNSIARSLYKKKTNTIGVLIPDIENPFFPELYKKIESNANVEGYNILLFSSNYDIKREKKFIELMSSKTIDAAIIVSDTLMEQDLAMVNIPLLTIDRKISDDITSITVNNYNGGKMAVDYLVNKGSENIIHISGPKGNETATERLKGFKDRMIFYGYTPIIVEGDYQITEATASTLTLFEEHSNIDGIFAGNDLIAVGVIKALAKMNIDYRSINLIGFDGISVGNAITPEITTLKQPIDKIANDAIKLLLSEKDNLHKVHEVTLIERET